MKFKEKLVAMVGNEFLFETTRENLIINNWNFQDEQLILNTSKGDYSCVFTDIDEFLKKFLPVEAESSASTELLAENNQQTGSLVFGGGVLLELKNTVMESIRKVKDNKEYIPQATAINEGVKQIVELAKTEIAFMETVHKLKD